MTANKVSTAIKEIEALFRQAWYPFDCEYPSQKLDPYPDNSETWARWSIQHTDSFQSTLANNNGKSRRSRVGTVIVQVFSPLNGDILSAYNAAEIVVNAYEGKQTASGVWFRNVRINEISGQESTIKNWFQLNVLADFVYDQIN